MRRAVGLLATLLVATTASAQLPEGESLFGGFSLTSAKEPIEIRADSLWFDSRKREATFSGTVEVIQGDIRIDSDTLKVGYAEVDGTEELEQVVAEGNVRISQGKRRAHGDRAVFDDSKRVLVLTGNATLEEGSNQISGDTIMVYPDDSRMEVKGENRRVKVILFPESTKPETEPKPESDAES